MYPEATIRDLTSFLQRDYIFLPRWIVRRVILKGVEAPNVGTYSASTSLDIEPCNDAGGRVNIEQEEATTGSDGRIRHGEQPLTPKAVLEELFELLENYGPTWYTEHHHNR